MSKIIIQKQYIIFCLALGWQLATAISLLLDGYYFCVYAMSWTGCLNCLFFCGYRLELGKMQPGLLFNTLVYRWKRVIVRVTLCISYCLLHNFSYWVHNSVINYCIFTFLPQVCRKSNCQQWIFFLIVILMQSRKNECKSG